MNGNPPPTPSTTSRRASCERDRSRRRRERVFVLGPPGIAVAATVWGLGEAVLATLWLAAIAWTVLASFALALVAGLRRGDWSAFLAHEHEGDREEELDLDTRTGGYRFIRERDERVLADGNDFLH